ncbi:unnamed protein product [Periconia digitata]|uniref:Uncharacterized protein n=1 Tax=Periconia digitata TaxID=1303443 RepID=A0A9W4XG35_9PLEO|nr:unnamed protein product [Periconia digitata]
MDSRRNSNVSLPVRNHPNNGSNNQNQNQNRPNRPAHAFGGRLQFEDPIQSSAPQEHEADSDRGRSNSSDHDPLPIRPGNVTVRSDESRQRSSTHYTDEDGTFRTPRSSSFSPESTSPGHRNEDSDDIQELLQEQEDNPEERPSIELPLDMEFISGEAQGNVSLTPFNYSSILLTKGYIAMIDAVYAEAKWVGHFLTKEDGDNKDIAQLKHWRKIGLRILASSPLYMILYTLNGFLAFEVINTEDPSTEAKELAPYFTDTSPGQPGEWFRRQNEEFAPAIFILGIGGHAPAIYIRILVDSGGVGPTYGEI